MLSIATSRLFVNMLKRKGKKENITQKYLFCTENNLHDKFSTYQSCLYTSTLFSVPC